MNSLKQLAEIYQEDEDEEEDDIRNTSCLQIDKRGTKRSIDERENSEDKLKVPGISEAEKSR